MSTTVMAVPQQTLQGTYTSNNISIPSTISSIEVDAIMNSADISNSAYSLTLSIQQSFDGGTTWQPWVSVSWQGGPQNVNHAGTPVAPSFLVYTGGISRTARIILTVPVAFSVGAQVTIS